MPSLLSLSGCTKRAALHVAKRLGLFRLSRRLTRGKLRILAYHGFAVADEDRFRPGLFIRTDSFRRRLEYLARTRVPVLPLGEALARLAQGTLPPCATVITIDDGFCHVLDQAGEVLKQFGFPATVYVTSYYCRCANPVFRLAVQYMFWKSPKQEVDLSSLGAAGLEGKVVRLDRDAHEAMWALIRHGETRCDEAQRVGMCEALAARLGVDYEAIKRSRILSLLTPEELGRLAASGIDVQLHTHRHRFPDDPAEARREIDDNRAALAPHVPGPLEHFCYPSGEWSERQWPWLAAAGMRSAVTCDPGLNDAGTPAFALRRFLDSQEVSQIVFEAEISGLLELLRQVRRGLFGL